MSGNTVECLPCLPLPTGTDRTPSTHDRKALHARQGLAIFLCFGQRHLYVAGLGPVPQILEGLLRYRYAPLLVEIRFTTSTRQPSSRTPNAAPQIIQALTPKPVAVETCRIDRYEEVADPLRDIKAIRVEHVDDIGAELGTYHATRQALDEKGQGIPLSPSQWSQHAGQGYFRVHGGNSVLVHSPAFGQRLAVDESGEDLATCHSAQSEVDDGMLRTAGDSGGDRARAQQRICSAPRRHDTWTVAEDDPDVSGPQHGESVNAQ